MLFFFSPFLSFSLFYFIYFILFFQPPRSIQHPFNLPSNVSPLSFFFLFSSFYFFHYLTSTRIGNLFLCRPPGAIDPRASTAKTHSIQRRPTSLVAHQSPQFNVKISSRMYITRELQFKNIYGMFFVLYIKNTLAELSYFCFLDFCCSRWMNIFFYEMKLGKESRAKYDCMEEEDLWDTNKLIYLI